jgi:predicted DsbA family dithiol-disulfide isomerase
MELYVDPCCPFAWIAYQWLAEVQQQRALELGLQLMSLPMLNEHHSISPGYRRLLAHTWGPARVAAAAVQQHGSVALAALLGSTGPESSRSGSAGRGAMDVNMVSARSA